MSAEDCRTCAHYTTELVKYGAGILASDSNSVTTLIDVLDAMMSERGSACYQPDFFCVYKQEHKNRLRGFMKLLEAAEGHMTGKDNGERDEELRETLAEYVRLRRK